MRIKFWDIFRENPNRTMSPTRTVRIGSVTLTPNVTFSSAASFNGVNLAEFAGRDLEVEQGVDGVAEIKSYY